MAGQLLQELKGLSQRSFCGLHGPCVANQVDSTDSTAPQWSIVAMSTLFLVALLQPFLLQQTSFNSEPMHVYVP